MTDYRNKRDIRISLQNFSWKPNKEENILRKHRRIFDYWTFNNTFLKQTFLNIDLYLFMMSLRALFVTQTLIKHVIVTIKEFENL